MLMLSRFFEFSRSISRKFSERNKNIVKSDNYKERMLKEIGQFIQGRRFTRVLEAGGIDRPLLTKSAEMQYDGLDLEYKPQCREIYDEFFVQSVESPLKKRYDLICSFTLLEHVQNNIKSFEVMNEALVKEGMMIHYLPSKYHPYSLILRMLGPHRAARLLHKVHPHTKGICGYPSYFHKCSVTEMQKLCKECGFEEVVIIPYYRANSYFEILFPAFLLVTFWENICRKLNWSIFCSGFILIAKK